MDSSKTEAVSTFPRPKTQNDVRSFLGLCNYYRRFVQKISKIATPLNQLLQKDKPFHWDDKCQTAFEKFEICSNYSTNAYIPRYECALHFVN